MIALFFRAKREGVNSMEMVFGNLDRHLLPHENIRMPKIGGSTKAVIGNIIYAYKHRKAINHITGDVHYIAIGTGRNTVLTVHDVQSVQYGSTLKKIFLRILWVWIPALIVKRITVISEFTKKELIGIVPFAKNKIKVIHNAFCPDFGFVKKHFNAECPTILHMGTNANKNLERTVSALNDVPCHLIVVGKLSESQRQLLDSSRLSYENYYDVAYSQIIAFYQRCDIVSFPSTYEGFGVPVLEANAAGRPIVVGDIEVLHEVGGSAACYVNPHDTAAIRNGFTRVIADEKFRNHIIEEGFVNIKRFTPEVIANEYNEVYKDLK